MIRNYILTAVRNFRRHSFFSILNIVGLAIGIASALLILQYVQYERGYDAFHKKADQIYRIQYNSYQNGNLTFECAAAVPAVGPALLDNFPEITAFARLLPTDGIMTYRSPTQGEISFREDKMQLVDPAIFDIFDFKLIKGDPTSCLDNVNKVVLSESAANKYFGDEEPLGKTMSFNGEVEFTVSGVMEDVPENSHIKFNFLASNQYFGQFDETWEESWGWYDHNTYVAVREGTDMVALQNKWDAFLVNTRGEDWEKYNYRQEFIFQPLTDIHLTSNLLQESEPQEQGDEASVNFLSIIAIFLLIIAWVNYINLATAKSLERANEVGVRKVMGAFTHQLRNQFLMESILLNLIATGIAVLLVVISWPSFVALSGRQIPFTLLSNPSFWAIVVALFLTGALLAGLYPALVLSSFKPVTVLKGKINSRGAGSTVRQALVVFQFLASVVLITGSLIVYQQLNFMRNQELGVDINETLVINGPGVVDSLYENNLKSFKNEIIKLNEVQAITAATNIPGKEIIWTRGSRRLSGGPENSITTYVVGIDEAYFPALNIRVVAGRNFSLDFPNDNERIMINQSMADALEYETAEAAIGDLVNHAGDTLEIIGVAGSYHQMSLKNEPAPMVFRYIPANNFYALKIQTDDYRKVVEAVEDSYVSFFPGNPFDYFFLDAYFNAQYDREDRFSKTFTLFTLLAIFVACLGLFGLASYLTSRRTKEIGVRKVLGSSRIKILATLAAGFMKLVGIGILLGWPLSWFLMDGWLSQFPYRVDIQPGVFLLSGVLVFIIALVSVSYQTFKTASVNPANTLRYE